MSVQDDPKMKYADRVNKLLERAAHPATPDDEREECLRRADIIMQEHKLNDAILRARAGATESERERKSNPEVREWDWVRREDEFFQPLVRVLSAYSDLVGVRTVYGNGTVTSVGFPEDIDYLTSLWLSTYLTFSSKLFPEWDPTATPGMNIRCMAEAGYKWVEIWAKARNAGHPLTHAKTGAAIPCPPDDNGWMKRAMAKAYAETGEEKPKLTHGRATYRGAFAAGFQETVVMRADAMKMERRRREREAGSGAELVLARDGSAVERLFNITFPPGSLGSMRSGRGHGPMHDRAHAAGGAAGRSVDMAGGQRVGSAERKAVR